MSTISDWKDKLSAEHQHVSGVSRAAIEKLELKYEILIRGDGTAVLTNPVGEKTEFKEAKIRQETPVSALPLSRSDAAQDWFYTGEQTFTFILHNPHTGADRRFAAETLDDGGLT